VDELCSEFDRCGQGARLDPHAAADSIAGFHDGDVLSSIHQVPSGAQPGDSRADDDDIEVAFRLSSSIRLPQHSVCGVRLPRLGGCGVGRPRGTGAGDYFFGDTDKQAETPYCGEIVFHIACPSQCKQCVLVLLFTTHMLATAS
jgi:hypothetical protein